MSLNTASAVRPLAARQERQVLSEVLAMGSLVGFAGSSAIETALLTLSLVQEKRLTTTLERYGLPARVTHWYRQAFGDWKKHPLPMLMAILIFNNAFSMLWCLVGLNCLHYAWWAPVVVGAILFFFGELLPKVMGRRFPEAILVTALLPYYFLFSATRNLFAPLARYLEKVTHWHLPTWLYYPMTETEIRKLLADTELTQDLRPRSRFVLEAMLEFSSRRVKETMQPASKVFFISIKDGSLEAMLPKILLSGYSRIPVSLDGALQNTAGVLYVKDLLFTFATSGLVNLQDILKDCPVVEESDKLGPLLVRFREGGTHIALVKNKAGQITGMISLEDILEELVGDIRDEFSPA